MCVIVEIWCAAIHYVLAPKVLLLRAAIGFLGPY